MRQLRGLSAGHGPRVVAIGGGHGLAASLKALRRVSDNLTAVVGVSDDGGSSGRLRQEFSVLPPGDLREALAALCGDDTWGRTWSRVVQHRFGGEGELNGHSLGNLLIMSLWEETGDVVAGLDWVAALLGAQGRVLPVSLTPLEIVADVGALDPDHPDDVTEVRGQVAVATTPGVVRAIRVDPDNPSACPEALEAVAEADVIVLGPGSWFTSVIAPLLVEELAEAVRVSSAQRVVVLNLVAQPGETTGFTASDHISALTGHVPGFTADVVVADTRSVTDPETLAALCEDKLGAQLVVRPVAAPRGRGGVHDPDLLAAAFAELTGRDRITPWR
ncbi:MAG: uridine diphosphate-N-acetylglucosamine-binding protein YvcK [Candidatus Nanopelagicales bacterium]